MLAVKPFINSIIDLALADVDNLAAVSQLVGLLTAPFVPSQELTYADIEPNIWVAGGVKTPSPPHLYSFDPVTGKWLIYIQEPLGGFRWGTGAQAPDPPITIYGYYHAVDITGTKHLLGTELLPSPITLDGEDQLVIVPYVAYRLANPVLS